MSFIDEAISRIEQESEQSPFIEVTESLAATLEVREGDFFMQSTGDLRSEGILRSSLVLMRPWALVGQQGMPGNGEIVLIQFTCEDGSLEYALKMWRGTQNGGPVVSDGADAPSRVVPRMNYTSWVVVAAVRGVITKVHGGGV